ncbi:MAG: RNA-binding transcriptional accessory protein [Lentisphaerae bacterium]|nr:RNA-binding transcriptional accessory protein [Lentisphaerota bacterium]MBT4815510.1 RNA-binding transcriptional accessory protein [Lentisphaerota bacterium]MBT5606490.1 RNA-binding transcriptional accessory protein [Lentisphaerota bacterium]MBT7058850.1 RNA-binding transcriptional accessory protein [Lentisphaerota bacterium]MBT7846489.1 RNA-binding transcriptional accessory protein [Lentisphaerota bacterium]
MSPHQSIAQSLGIAQHQVEATRTLLAEGGTVPFIARYRKERTGSLDEVAIAAIRDELKRLDDLEKRRRAILTSLEERDLLNAGLKQDVTAAGTLSALEDVYLPFRPKRRTRAEIARERGLEPLATILSHQAAHTRPEQEGARYLAPREGVASVQDALAGARDILAEWVSESAPTREDLRRLLRQRGVVSSKLVKGKEEEGAKFRDYFEWQEPIGRVPSHRLLAVFRGEREGVLQVRLRPPEVDALRLIEQRFVKGSSPSSEHVRTACADGYKRLLAPAMETEARTQAREQADDEAIRVFAANVRQILMAPPLPSSVLAIDPGLRTGCKAVCLDRTGMLLTHTVLYTAGSEKAREEAHRVVLELHSQRQFEAIGIGNGTGGREAQTFMRSIGLPESLPIVMVNESGASIYSASQTARDEFPDLDLTVRGAISIGRRLIDPLAELVKMDPKSIGVGQYQHDVDQKKLKTALEDVVTSCVNRVGVDVNTAGRELLGYVSGVGPQLAESIVAYRTAHGPFSCRSGLKDVPRLGAKAFELAAGFLRIAEAVNPLDHSAVHPERYDVVRKMAKDLGVDMRTLVAEAAIRQRVDLGRYTTDDIGLPTLQDIMGELAQPGRDPRRAFEATAFSAEIKTVDDVKPDMVLAGEVTNVTRFGAFVDIGVHQDGLVHISEIADRFVSDPSEELRVGQTVRVVVLSVERDRNRIALSIRRAPRGDP